MLDRSADDDFRAFMEAIDYPWVTLHVLKHSAVTLMRRGGAEFSAIAALTETDERTLRKVYNHVTADEKLLTLAARRS